MFSERKENDQTAVTILLVFKILSFVALLVAHFTIEGVVKSNMQ